MNKDSVRFKWNELRGFLGSTLFRFTLIRIAILVVILWILHSFFLDFYTNHGQKLKLARYEGQTLQKALKLASPKGFDMVVTDSIFVMKKPGGIILSQIPKPGSIVKRGRTIYVTVSRYSSESISTGNLPDLYGKKYEHCRLELFNSFELHARIAGTKFDPGQEGHVLEVYYKSRLVSNDKVNEKNITLYKGDTLDFIISNSRSGEIPVPDLDCKTLSEAKFLLAASKLNTGKISFEGAITNEDILYVIDQQPALNEKIQIGGEVHISLSDTKPDRCQ